MLKKLSLKPYLLLALIIYSINAAFAFQSFDFGMYVVNLPSGWSVNTGQSDTEFFVLQDAGGNFMVKLKKNPSLCDDNQAFNKEILNIIQDFYKKGEFLEQRKSAILADILGQKSSHAIFLKTRDGDHRRCILNPRIGNQMFHIDISGKLDGAEIPASVLSLLKNIVLKGDEAKLNVTNKVIEQREQTVADPNTNAPTKKDDLSSYKKVKEPVLVQESDTKKEANIKVENNPGVKKEPKEQPPTGGAGPEFKYTGVIEPGNIDKGSIPEVKFSISDPCSPSTRMPGLPWDEPQQNQKPASGQTLNFPAIPELKSLSDAAYNAAVAAAFEAMRLIYGPMLEAEYKKFEAVWAPLFDYPTQEIIDYLNKLTPLALRFLSCRESFTRTLSDIQMLLFDASVAIESDDKKAWEIAMAEAGFYADATKSLEEEMKILANQIALLGNPPDPNKAKCEAQRRYKKMLTVEGPEGCWAGYHDNLFLSDGKYSFIKTDQPSPEVLGLVHSPKYEYIFKVFVNGVEKYYSIAICIDCNLGISDYRGNCSNGSFSDKFIRENIFGKDTYTGLWIDGPRQGEESQYVEKFDFPDIPEFSEVSELQIRKWIELDAEHNRGFWAPQLQKMLQMHTLAPIFYKTAISWTEQNRWQQFSYSEETWMPPDDLLVAFAKEMAASMPVKDEPVATNKPPRTQNTEAPQVDNKSSEEAEKAELERKEAIDFHNEMIGVIKNNLEREIADRDKARMDLMKATTPEQAKAAQKRLEEFDLRIIHLQSNMQAEQDLVSSFQTGQIVRTRTFFDEYARNKFIDDIRENAARVDATRRIAERIERQIELLPWEMRAEARERARKIIDGKTIASGDLEKAKRLVNAINNQVQGYAEYDLAQAQEAEVDAAQNEFYAQMTIAAAGGVMMGLGSAALAEAFGAEAAITIYGTKALGAIYGGTTGLIAGGPKEGLAQAVSWWSPLGYTTVQFIEGYRNAGYQKDASVSSQLWEGAKQAGTAYLIGKGFELGVGLITKGSLICFGKDSRLFKPIISNPNRSKQVLDAMRTTQNLANAQDDINAFQKLENQLIIMKQSSAPDLSKIAQLEAELQQLAASLNASYYAKWLFKYKAAPGLRRQFDVRIQKNYANMTPGMKNRMEQQGYNMEGIEFVQFRNSTSGGSSSMDLDLGPVSLSTGSEPGIKMFKSKMVVKKDGSVVTMEQFMKDAQQAMNAEYRRLHGLSAPSSDMNLVTSAHPEAFASPRLLDHKIDFSSYSAEEVASIGKVLEVKMAGINKNQMLTNTTKMQAKCRESSKEIENMLLRKLRGELQKAPAGSPQQKQLEADIRYWENMLKHFKTIGTEETNPMKLIELNREIMRETGGKDVNGVINDLIKTFR